jgi:hypothetical protein
MHNQNNQNRGYQGRNNGGNPQGKSELRPNTNQRAEETPTTGTGYQEITSASLGISAERKADLCGLILSPREITESVMLLFIKLGVSRNQIHSVRIARGNKDNGLEISMTVEEDAVTSRGEAKVTSWIGISERATKLRIRPEIYEGLKNKAFAGNLHYQKEKYKGDNYIVINFDAELLLSFIYNVDFSDAYLKVSPIEVENDKKCNKKLGYRQCGAIMTFSNDNVGFNPKQVESVYGRD